MYLLNQMWLVISSIEIFFIDILGSQKWTLVNLKIKNSLGRILMAESSILMAESVGNCIFI